MAEKVKSVLSVNNTVCVQKTAHSQHKENSEIKALINIPCNSPQCRNVDHVCTPSQNMPSAYDFKKRAHCMAYGMCQQCVKLVTTL